MNTSTKTRTQRRMEKKQALILLVLVLVVSLASFTLCVVVGRQGAERDLVQKQQAAEKILVTKAPQPDVKVAPQAAETLPEGSALTETAAPGTEETKLTFYANLAKEETVPLGSGINLPPQQKVEKKTVVPPPIPLPDQPIVTKTALPVAAAKVETKPNLANSSDVELVLPKSDKHGTYAVQVGSFANVGDAGKFKKRLLNKGYPAFVAEADLGAKGLWYRVRIGPYTDAAAAKTVQQLAEKKEQIKGFISRQ